MRFGATRNARLTGSAMGEAEMLPGGAVALCCSGWATGWVAVVIAVLVAVLVADCV